ncbi:MAG: Ig-like domain-containing protein [Gemmatimonadaceae bacterium]|nr:Ig-like domain-containing protein [Gemmatimonadaceae bacterium]
MTARRGWLAALACAALPLLLAACSSDADPASCGGIVEPRRVLVPSPPTLTIDAGTDSLLRATLTGGCSTDDRTLTWESNNTSIATVDAAGRLRALSAGDVTIVATIGNGLARASVLVTVRPRVATVLAVTPALDTLSPAGSRPLAATVRDQNGALLAAGVAWRSLTPELATVTSAGVVTATANGVASIEAATQRLGADSLRDTVEIVIVPACSIVRAVPLGTTVTGTFDASTCQNLHGFKAANQYSVTTTAQAYYALRLVPASPLTAGLVPMNIGSALYALPAADTAVTALAVVRAGTVGFLVTAPSLAPGSYSVVTELDPDPRLTCATTDVTTGVNFRTALTPACTARDLRILPSLGVGQQVRITASAVGFPVTIELRHATTNVVIQRATAAGAAGTATIAFTNGTVRPVILRVSGAAGASDFVTVVLAL